MDDVLLEIWNLVNAPLGIGGIYLPSIIDLVLRFVLPLLGGMLVLRVSRSALVRAIERSAMADDTKSTLRRWIRIVFRILWLVFLVILTTLLLGAELFAVMSALGVILNDPFFKSGDLSISIMTLLSAIPVFYVASWVGKASRNLVETEILKRIPVAESSKFSIANVTRYAIMLLVSIIGLSLIGINLSSLLVIFSVLGIGIGFGLQSTVANLFAGLVIIFTRPIKEGDYILANSSGENLQGKVIRISLLYSVINTLLDETIIIPNSEIIGKAVHNFSYEDPEVVIPVIVQVHYDSDIDRVEEVLGEAARACPFWNRKNEPVVRIRDFASSGIEMGVFLRISNAQDRLTAQAWVRKEIWRRFRDASIIIPYPQLDLYIKEQLPKD